MGPRLAVFALAASTAVIVLATAAAAPADLDPTFGTGGKVVTDFGGSEHANGVAILGNGKIVVAGASGDDFALARYLPDGSLDPVFDGDGKVTTDFGGDEQARGVAIQADGRIVAAGTHTAGKSYFAVARYRRDGSLDTSFASDGTVVTGFGQSAFGEAVAIQGDGKIIVAGGGNYEGFALARFDPDGSLDESFGDGGLVTTVISGAADGAEALAVQPDGRIVAAGAAGLVWWASTDFALARYLPDGSLDPSFDGDGRVTTNFAMTGACPTRDGASDVVLQADGKILAAGWVNGGALAEDAFAFARYNPDGSLDARGGDWPLDTSFGVDGLVTTILPGFDEGAVGVALQSDGKIVAAGHQNSANGYEVALVRLDYAGDPDPGFGAAGLVTIDFDTEAVAADVAIQNNGAILVVGTVLGPGDLAAARLLGDTSAPPIGGVPPGVP
jgi:uncharacterized delta-60 repeat protein